MSRIGKQQRIDVLALDLEATLISDVFSRIPRPGLGEFLEFCHGRFPRIVMFTGASEQYFREVATHLVNANQAPSWFATLEYIHWDRNIKNLDFIPNARLENIVLIDDYPPYIHPDQKENWLEINPFDERCEDDRELERIQTILCQRLDTLPPQSQPIGPRFGGGHQDSPPL